MNDWVAAAQLVEIKINDFTESLFFTVKIKSNFLKVKLKKKC